MAWRFALLNTLKKKENIIDSNDFVNVINDSYPKAEKHFLVVAKKNISGIANVTRDDLDLLKAMDEMGREITEKHETRNFRIGYHAVPSMERLHLHVVSDDFNSPALKNKKHWNSFTTDFFIESKKVIEDVEKEGKAKLPSEIETADLLKTKLKCHKCDLTPKDMPTLKKHLLTHLKNDDNDD